MSYNPIHQQCPCGEWVEVYGDGFSHLLKCQQQTGDAIFKKICPACGAEVIADMNDPYPAKLRKRIKALEDFAKDFDGFGDIK